MKKRLTIAAISLMLVCIAMGVLCWLGLPGRNRSSRDPMQRTSRTDAGAKSSARVERPTDVRASALYRRAFQQADEGKMDLAINTLDGLVEKEPDSKLVVMALYQRAIGLESLGRVDEARAAYRRVQKEFPKSYICLRARERLAKLENREKHLSAAVGQGELEPLSYEEAGPSNDVPKADCGPEALYQACKLAGIQSTLQDLRELAGTGEKGTTMLGLAKAARAKGWDAQGLKVNYAYLQEMPMPVIAWMNGDHFLLVTKAEGAVVDLFDPGKGDRKISRQEFSRMWSGYVLALATNIKTSRTAMPTSE